MLLIRPVTCPKDGLSGPAAKGYAFMFKRSGLTGNTGKSIEFCTKQTELSLRLQFCSRSSREKVRIKSKCLGIKSKWLARLMILILLGW